MKTVDEIYGALAAEFKSRTGREAGQSGDLAARLWAVAAQICALEAQNEWTTRQCFPQTAAGEHLEMHASLRGVERRAAAKAEGSIRFSVDKAAGTNLSIPKGTVCMTAASVRFETTAAGVITAGKTYVDVSAQALETGAGGNVGANTVLSMAVAPVGVSRCDNPAAFVGGLEAESDEELRGRVLETFQRLPNGANAAFYEQGAMSFPEVVAAVVLPRNRGVGTVDVVVAKASGIPDAALLAKVKTYFRARREIAVDVGVMSPMSKSVSVTVAVTPAAGWDFAVVKTAVEKAIRSWFSGSRLGKNVLVAELGRYIFSVEGVSNYKLTAPAADVAVTAAQLPQLGTLTVTQL